LPVGVSAGGGEVVQVGDAGCGVVQGAGFAAVVAQVMCPADSGQLNCG
jgi:hypothetical protein